MASKEILSEMADAKEFRLDFPEEIDFESQRIPCNQPRPVPQPCGKPPSCRCTIPTCRPCRGDTLENEK
jgi:hypothetical protein